MPSSSAAAPAAAAPPSSAVVVDGAQPRRSWWAPNPALNYGFIAGAYAFLTLVSLTLWTLHVHGGVAGHGLAGAWIVPAPAAPALLWALLQRWRSARARKLQ